MSITHTPPQSDPQHPEFRDWLNTATPEEISDAGDAFVNSILDSHGVAR